jgi:hypothetical protein
MTDGNNVSWYQVKRIYNPWIFFDWDWLKLKESHKFLRSYKIICRYDSIKDAEDAICEDTKYQNSFKIKQKVCKEFVCTSV